MTDNFSDRFVIVSPQKLSDFMMSVFQGVGVPEADAKICTEILLASDLRGIDSHGVARLKMYYDRIKEGIQHPVTRLEVVKETPTTIVIDGHLGMGQVVGYRAMEYAINKAKVNGLGAAAVRNSTHFGIAGYYSLMAITHGMIGLTCTNARPSIAPTFGAEPMLGTNPLAIGFPTDEAFPFLFDAATSIIQRGKIETLDRLQKPAQEGWVIDDQGAPLTDPTSILKQLTADTAALLPLGGANELFSGHKGYGFATIVEVLSAALQDGAFLKQLSGFDEQGNKTPYRVGHFFLAINIENFIELDRFKTIAGTILRSLRSSRKAPGQDRIYTANEKGYQNELYRREHGIPITKVTANQIKVMHAELKLAPHLLPL